MVAERLINIKEASEILGLHPETLRRWEKNKTLPFKVIKTSGGQRRFKYTEIQSFLNNQASGFSAEDNQNVITAIYCHVSSNKQKEDLETQEKVLLQYCLQNNILQPIVLKEIGSSLNFERVKFKKLIDLIEQEEIQQLIIQHPDRLVRFGFELIQQLCEKHHVKLICLNHNPDKTIEEELVSDFISLVVSFSGKLYGHRSHKNKQVVEGVKNLLCHN